MNKTSISWVLGPDGAPGFSWNPVIGCAAKKVSPGCAHCYAERLAATRLAHLPAYAGLAKMVHRATGVGGGFEDVPRWTGEVRFFPEKLAEPLRRRKPAGIFVGDMGDIALLPFEQIAAIFGVMAACPQHRFYVLTKRPELLREWFAWIPTHGVGPWTECHWRALKTETGCNGPIHTKSQEDTRKCPWPLPNVWVGASASTQKDLDRVVPELLRIPAAIHFISGEPLLGELDFGPRHSRTAGGNCSFLCPGCWHAQKMGVPEKSPGIDWVIVGGESGPNARPCHVEWIRSIVRQCAEAGVACWVKQAGAMPVFASSDLTEAQMRFYQAAEGERGTVNLRDRAGADIFEWPADLRVRQMPEVES